MVCLLHEKPFAGVNGSGKHVNFSFGNATQGNLLDPGDTPHENAQFLVFCGAVIRAVHKYARPAARRHRHRRQRSPPGRQRSAAGDHLDLPRRAAGRRVRADQGRAAPSRPRRAARWRSASTRCRSCRSDAGDRNRTSPFAFTGNRFEFRAVGSSQSIAGPLVALNTVIAESLDYIATKLEAAVASGKKLNAAIQEVLAEIIQQHGAVIFNGNGYSAEWHAGGREARPAELQDRGRRAAGAAAAGRRRAVRQVQGAVAARAARAATRSTSSSTSRR